MNPPSDNADRFAIEQDQSRAVPRAAASATADAQRLELLKRLYWDGVSMDEIGAELGVTKQRVDQLLTEHGVPRLPVGERRYAAVARRQGPQIIEHFLRTRDEAVVAAELGLPLTTVKRFVDASLPDAQLLRRRRRDVKDRYSDTDLLSAVAEAARQLPSPLTSTAYGAWAQGRLWGERPWPGPQAVALRFGGWRRALVAADLPANPASGARRTFELQDAIEAVVTAWQEAGRFPSAQRYEQWSMGKDGVPSLATARHLVESWDDLLLAAYPLVHGIALPGFGTAEPEPRVADEGSDELGQPYRRASEDCVLESSEPFERDPERLERSLRSHNALQNQLSDLAIERGLCPLSPGPDDPAFDVAWRTGGRQLTVVEVKSASPETLEFQMRLGLGQILRYAHQLEAQAGTVRRVLAVELPPDDSWSRLCEELGVTLVWPGVLDRTFESEGPERPGAAPAAPSQDQARNEVLP